MPPDSAALPSSAPPAAEVLFGSRLALAEQYVHLLGGTGIAHGLLGPAEGARLWDRHVLNCAVIAPAFHHGALVVDIGSGAGLPGIVLAIARPDLQLVLVEPLQRRTTWLSRTVSELGLDNVEVHTGRAQSLHGRVRARHTTARAVARLGVLAAWSLPLLEPNGSMLAVKGSTAEAELAQDRAALRALGATSMQVETYGDGLLAEPARVVQVRVGTAHPGAGRRKPTDPRRGARTSSRGRGRRSR